VQSAEQKFCAFYVDQVIQLYHTRSKKNLAHVLYALLPDRPVVLWFRVQVQLYTMLL